MDRCLDFILSGKALECYGKDLGDEMKRVCVCVCWGRETNCMVKMVAA